MSRPRTRIRRKWLSLDATQFCSSCQVEKTDYPVLVIPDNPAARRAMVDRVADRYPHIDRDLIGGILVNALRSSPRH